MKTADLGQVLVTGGGGFLGTALVKLLVERGLAVRSLSRRVYPHLQELGVEQVQGDVADAQVVTAPSMVARPSSTPPPRRASGARSEEYERTNVEGTQNVIAACRAHGSAADHLQQLAQCGVQRLGHGRRR